MHLSCDIIVCTGDGRTFEWVLFVRSSSYAQAVAFAEQRVREHWSGRGEINELFVSADRCSWEKQAAGEAAEDGVYAAREPREIGIAVSPLRRAWNQLTGRRG